MVLLQGLCLLQSQGTGLKKGCFSTIFHDVALFTNSFFSNHVGQIESKYPWMRNGTLVIQPIVVSQRFFFAFCVLPIISLYFYNTLPFSSRSRSVLHPGDIYLLPTHSHPMVFHSPRRSHLPRGRRRRFSQLGSRMAHISLLCLHDVVHRGIRRCVHLQRRRGIDGTRKLENIYCHPLHDLVSGCVHSRVSGGVGLQF